MSQFVSNRIDSIAEIRAMGFFIGISLSFERVGFFDWVGRCRCRIWLSVRIVSSACWPNPTCNKALPPCINSIYFRVFFFWHSISHFSVPVVFLGQVPPVGDNITSCNKNRLALAGLCKDRCYNRAVIEERLVFSRAIFSKYSPMDDVYFFGPLPAFCEHGNACIKYFNGKILYRDDNHLLDDEVTLRSLSLLFRNDLFRLRGFVVDSL